MIDLVTTLSIHERLIDKYGGSKGIRDKGSLLAALARPYATFDQQELYPTPVEKAAAIFESVIINHPFMDGNKRTAYVLLRVTLFQYGFDIFATKIQKHEMTIAASIGDMRIEEIKIWIQEKLITIDQ